MLRVQTVAVLLFTWQFGQLANAYNADITATRECGSNWRVELFDSGVSSPLPLLVWHRAGIAALPVKLTRAGCCRW